MYPNIVLSVWQLTIMAVVPVVLLFAWLIAIYLASREPARQDLAMAGSPVEPATAGTGSRLPPKPGEQELERSPTDRQAA